MIWTTSFCSWLMGHGKSMGKASFRNHFPPWLKERRVKRSFSFFFSWYIVIWWHGAWSCASLLDGESKSQLAKADHWDKHREMTEPGFLIISSGCCTIPRTASCRLLVTQDTNLVKSFSLVYSILLAEIPQIDLWIKAISIKISTQFLRKMISYFFKSVWKSNKSKIGKPILKENNIEDLPYQIPRVF